MGVPQKCATQATKATQAFMFLQEKNPENDMIIVAFRGTSPFNADDWSTDLDLSWRKFKGMGKTHFGFMAALGLNRFSKSDSDHTLDRLEAIDTYGQPRVGDEKFGLFMKKTLRKHGIKYYRIVYAYDLVPSLPWDNTYKVYVVRALWDMHPLQQPLSLQVWELRRVFIIRHTLWPDFNEGRLQTGFRTISIILPQVATHGPQDYVNATRLVSKDLFLR
ncbi:LOW QUALITY PROTEIN: hypothetical protein Cgig2_008013 [Carnegiea gigantea]|uniref:Fungal lipase-type domain-containing protein n=1 Tax=Carnegiea gigantea TaxID=171969 RepID=A0A9Q1L270_9CARY|nr:LOW QUALITY PROTEIN: hypothetical protein Cgig2_008013 [Carnegiea gigantea]